MLSAGPRYNDGHDTETETLLRRADRLFQIVQLLRSRRLATAADLASELEVSERTIYRDIQDLMKSGVPIEGEAGVGYALPPGFDLPPLTFDDEELETLVLGARILSAWGGGSFSQRAKSLLTKVEAVLPDRLKERLAAVDLYAPDFHVPPEAARHLKPLRAGLRERRKITFRYETEAETTTRTVRPLGVFFWGKAWTLVGWCELREAFRNFRTDRMHELRLHTETFEDEAGRDLATFLDQVHRAHNESGESGEEPTKAPSG